MSEKFFIDFQKYKSQNIRIANAFAAVGLQNRAETIQNCSSNLLFGNRKDGSHDLIYGNFCKDRFCPLCQAKRSGRRARELKSALNYLNGEFLFLTLTVPNVKGNELSSKLKQMMDAFHDFIRDYRLKKGILGYIRNLEITYNSKENTFHPHFHVIINVSDTYFIDNMQYIKRDVFLQIWRNYMHDQSITQVDVRKIKSDRMDKAILETSKYFTKFGDWIYGNNAAKIIPIFTEALRNLNCTTMGGTIKKAVLKVREEKAAISVSFEDKVADIIQNANNVYYGFSIFNFYSKQTLFEFPKSHIGYYLSIYKFIDDVIKLPFYREKFKAAIYKVDQQKFKERFYGA